MACMLIAPEIATIRPRSTAFMLDCSHQTPDGLTTGCESLRDLFHGKEIISKGIESCGHVPSYPNPRWPRRVPTQREEYIHDSQTDLWYHCCEHRPRFKGFAIGAEEPRLRDPEGPFYSKGALDHAKELVMNLKVHHGIPDVREEPIGPLLQCNLLQNLKHRQDDDGQRMVVDEVAGSALSGLAESLTGMGATKCKGDQAVALRKFAGGTKFALLADDTGHCVDIGPPGAPTPPDKPYHVFQLRLPADVVIMGIMPLLPSARSQYARFL